MSRFFHLRNVRSILSQVDTASRERLLDELDAAQEAGASIDDLSHILQEDCGEYAGSWLLPNNR